MTPVEIIKSMIQKEYITPDGDIFTVELLDPYTPDELTELKEEVFSNQTLPREIEELLLFCSGFTFYGFYEIRFDKFYSSPIFTLSVCLATDSDEKAWMVDVDGEGNWHGVYLVSYDPPVVVKQAENLEFFLHQLDQWGMQREGSIIDTIHGFTIYDIWEEGGVEKDSVFPEAGVIFSEGLPGSFYWADLRNAPVKTGFRWGLDGLDVKVLKSDNCPVWLIEKKSLLGKLERIFK